jgi:hypothetical protein
MNRKIKFCYRKIINAAVVKAWERLVFEDSYAELKIQAQRFNPGRKYTAFSDIIANDPAAEQLHFLVSGSVIPYIRHLNEKIPDVYNTLGRQFLSFKNFRFEIINSDIKDSSKHTVAINFFSEPVTWIDSIGNTLVVATNHEPVNEEWLTDTIILQPFVSIYSVQQ